MAAVLAPEEKTDHLTGEITAAETEQDETSSIMSTSQWTIIKEQAAALEAAGPEILPKNIKSRYQIAAILMKGAELGFSAMYSLEQIAIVNGKPLIQSQALLALVERKHGRGAIADIESTNEKAVVSFRLGDGSYAKVTWTMEDAKRAGLLDKQGPWKQYPRTMLYWRAVAEGCRRYFAGTLAGFYLPEELDVAVLIDGAGNMLIDREHAVTEEPAPAKAQKEKPQLSDELQLLYRQTQGLVAKLDESRGGGQKKAIGRAAAEAAGITSSDHLTWTEADYHKMIEFLEQELVLRPAEEQEAPEITF